MALLVSKASVSSYISNKRNPSSPFSPDKVGLVDLLNQDLCSAFSDAKPECMFPDHPQPVLRQHIGVFYGPVRQENGYERQETSCPYVR